MQLWLIPSLYAAASIVAGLLVPRLEARFMASGLDLSTSSAQAYLSAVASGIERSGFDPEDRAAARIEDRQGLGLSHREDESDPITGARQGRVAS